MTIPVNVIRNREPDAAPTPLMGWYMPLAGVRYYKILTDVDAALGNARIGSVGWRDDDAVAAVAAPNAVEATLPAPTPAPVVIREAVPA